MNKICICINFYIEIEICDFRSSSFSFDFLIIQKIKPSPIPYQPFNCWFVHLREPEFRSFNWKQKRTDIKAGNLLCQSGFPLESLREASFLLLDFLAWIFLLFAFFLSFPFIFCLFASSIRWNDSRGNCRKRKCSIFNSSRATYLSSSSILIELRPKIMLSC